MADEIYVVAYDGESSRALDFAIERAKRNNAHLHIAHILEWSPYTFLTPEEISERHKRRTEELARAEEAIIRPAVKKADAAGLSNTTTELQYGSVVDLLAKIARDRKATLLFVGRATSGVAQRIFGSVPLGIAQESNVPVVIVP